MRQHYSLILLVSLCFALGAWSGVAQVGADEPQSLSLAVVAFGDWEGLQKLRGLGLHILDVREDVLLTLASAGEINALRGLGLGVIVLDAPAAPEMYYLASVPPTAPADLLERYAKAFPYLPEMPVLKADVEAIERLTGQGVMVIRLLGPVDLPLTPPSFAVPPSTVAAAYDPLIAALVQSVSQIRVHDDIRFLQDDSNLAGWDAKGSRYTFSSELPGKRDYIRGQMESILGASNVRHQSFYYYDRWLQNIEGTLSGWGPSSEVVYIACAHYDSTSGDPYNVAPGADDNASGVAGVLEAARVLSRYRFERTLRFVTFPAEEQGLYGSYHYVNEAVSLGTAIAGVLNLDMIAWDSNGDRHMDIHAGTMGSSQSLGAAFANAIVTYSLGLSPQIVTAGATTFSDHSRFWNRGYPAVLLIEDYYPNRPDFNAYYHTTNDTLARTNLPFAAEFVKGTVATLAGLARIIPPGLRVEHWGSGVVMTGTQTTLTVRYANPGPDPVTGLVMTDTLSAGLTYIGDSSGLPTFQPSPDVVVWQVGSLAPYTRRTFTVTVEVDVNLAPRTPLSSTVTGAGVFLWDDPADNQATWRGSVASDWQWLPLILKDDA